MDQQLTSEDSPNPLRMEQKTINGLSSLLPALGAQDVNKNHQDNILTRTVENVIRGLDKTNQTIIEHRDGSNKSYLPDHASQLLKAAAASAVIRGGHNAAVRSYKSEVDDYIGPRAYSNDDAVTSSMYYQHYDISNRTGNNFCNTTLSFSSKPAMSTGFSDHVASTSNPKLPTPISSVSATDLVISTKVNAAATETRPNAIIETKEIIVPFLWQRTCEDSLISYTSPSGVKLTSLSDVKKYLLNDDSCKCGLTCPFHVEKVFNFDKSYVSKPWTLSDMDSLSEKTELSCCHRKHLKSQVLADQCKMSALSAKISPVKRRIKSTTSRKTVSSKSSAKKLDRGSVTTSVMPENEESYNSNDIRSPIQMKPLISPLPSVEVVASQLRNARGLEVTPPSSHFSPNHLASGISPRLMSPSRDHSILANSYGIPTHLAGGPGYHPLAYPIHRPPLDAGIMMAASHAPGYYQPSLHSPVYTPGSAYPYHSQSAYEYLAGHPLSPAWGSPPHLMPPPGSGQYVPPMWQASKPESGVGSSTTPKRKRRASGKSGETSVSLGSPPAISPVCSTGSDRKTVMAAASNKAIKREDRDENHSGNENEKESVSGEVKAQPPISAQAESSHQRSQSTTSSASHAALTPHHPALIPPGAPPHLYLPPNTMPHTAAYMDPMYIARQHHPVGPLRAPGHPHPIAFFPPGQPNPYMYRPVIPTQMYDQKPRTSLPISIGTSVIVSNESAAAPVPESAVSPASGKTAAKSADVCKNDSQNSKECSDSAKQKLPGISTIAQPNTSKTVTTTSAHSLPNGLKSSIPSSSLPNSGNPTSSELHNLAHGIAHSPHHPMYMIPPGPNSQMYYRYYEPRYHHPSQQFFYPPGQIHPMYQHPGLTAGKYPYTPQGLPSPSSTSPKRKRRKATSKAPIESHSAVLVGTSDLNVESSPSKRSSPKPAVSTATNGVIKQVESANAVSDETTSSKEEISMQAKSSL